MNFLKLIYLKLFRINDEPQKVALGAGIGVFFGVFPGLGPVAALFVAVMVKANKAAALIGSLLTNTWISIPVFFVAVKTGSVITGRTYSALETAWKELIRDFSWQDLMRTSLYDIAMPVLAGYLAVSLCIGLTVYLVVLSVLAIKRIKHGGV